jgi:hypothetical protein
MVLFYGFEGVLMQDWNFLKVDYSQQKIIFWLSEIIGDG